MNAERPGMPKLLFRTVSQTNVWSPIDSGHRSSRFRMAAMADDLSMICPHERRLYFFAPVQRNQKVEAPKPRGGRGASG